MLFQSTTTTTPFSKWWYTDRDNRRLLLVSTLLIVAQYIWFKIQLPYPNFIQESYTYLRAATNNDFVNMLPIGYSKYLQLVGLISHSHLLPVLIQYLVLEIAIVYFFLTLKYLLNPGKWLIRVLMVITIINPLLLRVANLLTADALFAAISLVWFAQLLWLLYKPAPRLLVAHAFVLLVAVTLRDTGIYYPLLSLIAIVLSSLRTRQKLAYSGLIVLLFAIFVGATQYVYHERTGIIQLSAGRGWQAANNALYAYAHDPQDTGKNVEYQFRKLHALVNHQDSMKYKKHGPDETLGNYYSEDKGSPLYDYVRNDSTSKPDIKGGANRRLMMGPLYGKYALWLMKQHRGAFFGHFILPNTAKYFVPEPENAGYIFPWGSTDSVAIKWFHLSSNRWYTYDNDWRISVISYMPGLVVMSSLAFLLGFMAFGLSGGFAKTGPLARRIMVFALVAGVLHLIFSVILMPVVLRHQVFPFMASYAFGIMLLVFVVGEIKPANVPVTEGVVNLQ